MRRIHIVCEGQTEEMFVKELLYPPFLSKGLCMVPVLIGKPGHKGGNFRFERLLADVRNRLLGDPTAFCTTFFDFYGLPNNFPGKQAAADKARSQVKAQIVCDAMVAKLTRKLGDDAMHRFIPYIQMYEFEALLFSDPDGLAKGVECPELSDGFNKIRNLFDSPESINDSPRTAPSKRISSKVLDYEKPIYGSLAALEIGLPVMRQECPLFDAWLIRLEGLADEGETA
ncbi:MAG: DUF4276 family protein [Desulfuromusa sp.]|nr:DUF4276 family protein [Desulfuromusa sp.]